MLYDNPNFDAQLDRLIERRDADEIDERFADEEEEEEEDKDGLESD